MEEPILHKALSIRNVMCLLKINLLNYSQSRTPEADYRFYTNAERKSEMMKSLHSYGNSEEMP
jgi:hypothetical protein